MGSAIARRMAENGARVLTSLKGRSQATVDRAHQAGMISASDEEIAAHAELVLSVVPPGEALALAERLQPVFERQSRGPIFMDCNAVNSSTLDRIRAAIGQDEHFLDTCIIGCPPKLGGPSPTPLTAYAPLAQGRAANDPTLATIGRKRGATAAQVAIAWLLDQESVIAIPKAGRPESQKADLDALGISLDDEDRAAIAALPKDQRFVRPPFAPEWDAVA